MNDNKVLKFENPVRLSELNPKDTLLKAGFRDGMKLCDIGAGTGIFSFPAAEISSELVYALEVSDKMIEILSDRIKKRGIKNLEVRKVESSVIPVEDNSCDVAIMVTVLHEINDKNSILSEIKRILKKAGKLIIIEFHKRETPMGPPIDHRISEEFVKEICEGNGFRINSEISLGDNFFGVVFANL